MADTGPIATFGAITSGGGYTTGTFTDVPLTGGSGTGATVDITVNVGGAVSSVILHNFSASAVVDRTGKNYLVGDVVSANESDLGNLGGGGFSIPVATLAPACENCFYGHVVPESAGVIFGARYCSFNALINASQATPPSWSAKIVEDDYFCGNGADRVSGVAFSSRVSGIPAGPPGPIGATGATGPAGTNAPQWFFITNGAAPAGGNDGDFTIRTGTDTVNPGSGLEYYTKIAGVWTLILTLNL